MVRQAAALILADIREQQYDTEFYPTADEVAGDALHFLPPLLRLFLERLVKSYQRPFMQYVADNVDHNVRTLDGRGTFHGMGIISVSTFPKGTFGCGCHRVSRTSKRLTATHVTKADRCKLCTSVQMMVRV